MLPGPINVNRVVVLPTALDKWICQDSQQLSGIHVTPNRYFDPLILHRDTR
jgi:hypothetical protein